MSVKHKKSRRNNAKRRSNQHPSARGPFLVASPFNGAQPEDVQRFMVEIGAAAQETFNVGLERLAGHAGNVSGTHVVSLLANYALMTPAGDPIGEKRDETATDKVGQAHVEFMQALLLRGPQNEEVLPSPDFMQLLFDDLPALFRAHGHKSLSGLTDETDPSEDPEVRRTRHGVSMVQDYLRGHTASVRNWGYFGAVKQISSELLGRVDAEFRTLHGIAGTELVSLFEHMIRRFEGAMSELRRRYIAICDMPTAYQMGVEAARQFPDHDVSELRAILSRPGMNRDNAKVAVLFGLETVLPRFLLFDSGALARETGLDGAVLHSLLTRLSLTFGSLADKQPERLILDNPVWTRPLIQLQDDLFFCALPMTLMTFVVPIAESLLETNGPARVKLQDARTDYLEDSVDAIFRRSFPGCEPTRGFKWREGEQEFESDLAARVDTTLFLVESKSGRVSWPALRGAPGRVLRDVEELIVKPSDQSARLALKLRAKMNSEPGTETFEFPIPLAGLRNVVRLSVTLHDFATLQSVPQLMVDAGLVRSAARLAPCLSLADLLAVAGILDAPHLMLHYLRRRAELLPLARTLGDELDMLGLYLDTGFNLGAQAEQGEMHLSLLHYSVKVDRYYTGLDEGLTPNRPSPKLTQWLRFLCDQVMGRQFPGRSEVTHTLLCLDYSEQLAIEKALRRLTRRAMAGKPFKHGHDAVQLTPATHRSVAVVFHLRGPSETRSPRDAADAFSRMAFESDHVDFCVFLSFVPTADGPAYHSATQMVRADRPVQMLSVL